MFVELKSAIAIAKNKKGQSVLIGIVIMLISALLYIGISMMVQTNPFETMYERSNAAETMIVLDKSSLQDNTIIDWYKNRDEVKDVFLYKTSIIDCEYEVDDETQVSMVFATEFLVDNEYDLLYTDSETIASAPQDDDVIINYNFAKSYGFEIGDNIKLKFNNKSVDLEIVNIAVDPQFSTPFMTPIRVFVSPDFYADNNIENSMYIVSVKYEDINNVNDEELFDVFLNEYNEAFSPIFIGYEAVKSTYSIIQSIIAAVLIVVSLLIFVIVVFVIRSTVQNLILQQYRQIGVKKAIGYSNSQIQNSMILVFGSIGFIASVIGGLISLPIISKISASLGNDLQVDIHSSVNILLLVTVLIIIFLITLFTWIAAKKATKVKPVQAIKYGMPEYKVGNTKFSISKNKRGSLGMLLAIKQLLINKRKSFVTLFLIIILTYSAFTITNIGNTLTQPTHLASNLFGTNIGDCTFSTDTQGDINDYINKVNQVDGVETVIFNGNSLSESFMTTDDSSHAIGGLLVVGDIPDNYLILESGKQPVETNEIAISSEVVRVSNKNVGDYITIYGDDTKNTYLITGVYASISNAGFSYMSSRPVAGDSEQSTFGYFWVYFESEDTNFEDVKSGIIDVLGDGTMVELYDSNISNVLTTVEAFPMVISILSIVLLVVAGIIIFNAIIMDINNSAKVYGIMKATGFSKVFITRMLIIRGLLTTSIGIVIGLTANVLTMDLLMDMVFKLTPFSSISMPVLFNLKGCVILGTLFVVITIISTLIPSKRIGKISPKQLIAE